MDSDGAYFQIRPWEFDPSAADSLFTAPADYARFMAAAQDADSRLLAERTMIAVATDDAVYAEPKKAERPVKTGHSLDGSVYEYQYRRLVFHGGADWGERAIAAYDPEDSSGYVVVNGGGHGRLIGYAGSSGS